jgi:hypothetical protein
LVLKTSTEGNPEEVTKLEINGLKVKSVTDWRYSSKLINSVLELTRNSLKDPSVFESWYEQRDIGLRVTKNNRFGELHYKTYVSGASVGKLKSVTKVTGDQEIMLQQHYYDIKGRKLRSIMGANAEQYIYDDTNNGCIFKLNEKFIWEKKWDKAGKIIYFKNEDDNVIEVNYDSRGNQLYKLK